MFNRSFRKMEYFSAKLGLLITAVGTVIAFYMWGYKIGLLAAVVLFFLMDGINCIWTLVHRSTREAVHENAEAKSRENFLSDSENNPTIR